VVIFLFVSYYRSVKLIAHFLYAIVWLAAFLSFLLALPSLGSTVAFAAATSIATIGLYISYGIPILVGVIYQKEFVKGPFSLGKFSR